MLSKYFIFVHIPKTGGQCIMAVTRFARVYDIDKTTHVTIEKSRKKLKELGVAHDVPSFCFVRNPWDWYVSRCCFRDQRNKWEGEQYLPIDHCGKGPEGFRKHMLALKDVIDRGDCVRDAKGNPAETRTYDPITLSGWHYKMTEGGISKIGRFENFKQDAVDIFKSVCPFLEKEVLEEAFRERTNTSEHGHYREYYDDELKDLVEQWDKRYIDEFGYSF
jgi:hypothetical protein